MENNLKHFWGSGTRNDIAVCYEDYFDIINNINDERLSRKAMMDFKNLAEVNFYGIGAMAIYSFFPAVGLSYLCMGKAQRSHSGYRYQWMYFTIAYPLTMLLGFNIPIPRKLYTEIITDPSIDGQYVRNRIRQGTPGLWRKLSAQLYRKGYRFPELNENTDTTIFPFDFVNKI